MFEFGMQWCEMTYVKITGLTPSRTGSNSAKIWSVDKEWWNGETNERSGFKPSLLKKKWLWKNEILFSYEYHLLMNEQIKVLMLEFQIKLDEKVIHVLLDVLMDHLQDIAKQDPLFFQIISYEF